jgi:hypothetical protein
MATAHRNVDFGMIASPPNAPSAAAELPRKIIKSRLSNIAKQENGVRMLIAANFRVHRFIGCLWNPVCDCGKRRTKTTL